MNEIRAKPKDSEELNKVAWYYGLIERPSTIDEKVMCPIHGDRNPSLLLSLNEGRWYCFGCSKGGTALDLVLEIERKYHNLNDLEACRKYVKILKSNKCKHIKIDVVRNSRKNAKSTRENYDRAFDYYNGLRQIDWKTDEQPEAQEAREYMRKRGFTPQTLNKVKAKITYNDSYQIIFPLLENGKFKGWVSRTMKKDIEQKRKYLYNEGFSRASTMMGDYGSKQYVILVEGYMDRLKLLQSGITNVCCVLGWKMSAGQFEKLKKAGIKYVISALDNDECGRKGTRYLKELFGTSNVIRWQYLKCLKDNGEATHEQVIAMYARTARLFEQRTKLKLDTIK